MSHDDQPDNVSIPSPYADKPDDHMVMGWTCAECGEGEFNLLCDGNVQCALCGTFTNLKVELVPQPTAFH